MDLPLTASSPIFIHISGFTFDCQLSKFSFFHLDLPLIASFSFFHSPGLTLNCQAKHSSIYLTNSITLILYLLENLALILFKSIFLTFTLSLFFFCMLYPISLPFFFQSCRLFVFFSLIFSKIQMQMLCLNYADEMS